MGRHLVLWSMGFLVREDFCWFSSPGIAQGTLTYYVSWSPGPRLPGQLEAASSEACIYRGDGFSGRVSSSHSEMQSRAMATAYIVFGVPLTNNSRGGFLTAT